MYPEGTDNLKVYSKGEESEKGKPPPIGDGGGDSPDKVPETTKPKTIPEKPPHDRRAVSDAWVLSFKQHTGSDYVFNGARDGKAISDLLASVPADSIIETIHSAFDAASQNHQGAFWLKKLNSLPMFTSRYNEIRHEITELSKTIPKNTMNQGVHLQASQREWSKQIKINLEAQRRKGIEMVEHLKAERLKAAQQPPTPNEP